MLPEIEKRFIEYTFENYNVPKEKCKEIIKPFLQSILDASSYGFSWNHSDAYSCIGYICGYLRYYYPLEFLTVAFNIFSDNKEKSISILEYAKKKGIRLENPKFRYSNNDFSCNKSTNTIYKGMSCIKGLNKITGDKLYLLKDNYYSNFFDFLIDCKNNSISNADIIILTKLDYFSEFGSIGQLLKFIDIFNELYQKKILKKDKEYSVKLLYLKDFCQKEIDKQYSGFDSYKCLVSLIEKLPNKDIPIKEKINYQLQYYGYVDIKDNKIPDIEWAVTNIDERNKYKFVELYNLNNGERVKAKIRNNNFEINPFTIGDILKITQFVKEGKWVINRDTGKWEKSTIDFDEFIVNYIIKEDEK